MIARLRALPATGQLAVALCAAVLVGLLLALVPALVNPAILLGCVGVVAALAVLAQWLWQHQHVTDWSNTFTDPTAARGSDVRVTRLAETVDAGVAGDAVARARLHETLRALADERLRRRRGLSLSGGDAADVRAALGPDLTAYLADPPTGRLTAARVEAFITTLEEI
ncbi:hypothetical protein ACFUC1_10560 [Pedococcus sp. NPDC057267]|uniref:DUF7269 family protein n=1 Tax=Pedococcus sp. NPDC057267 TaxID=3346077 RepID=UPI003625B73A